MGLNRTCTVVQALSFINSMTAQFCISEQLRARTRGMDATVVLRLKIPIELQCDYLGGLLLQIA